LITFYEERPTAERLAAFMTAPSKSSTEVLLPKDLGENEADLSVKETTVLLRKAPEAPGGKEMEPAAGRPPEGTPPEEAPLDSPGSEEEPSSAPQDPSRLQTAFLPRKSHLPGLQPPLGGQRRWSLHAPALTAAGLACVALGFSLGYLGHLLEKPPQDEGAGGSPHTQSDTAALPEAQTASPSEPGAGSSPKADAAPKDVEENPLGPVADVKDPETRARLAVRLYLDIFGRPPTRGEMEELASGSAEDLWVRASKGLRPARSIDEQIDGIFPRFLGRKAQPREREKILSLAKGDPDHYAFLVAMSRDYASAGHRRTRPDSVLAQSLCVNLLDSTPKSDEEQKTLKALRDGKGGIRKAAETLLQSSRCKASPREGDSPESWLRGAYSRLILRFPTKTEEGAGAAILTQEKDGWRKVLAGIVTREEYLKY
jgi:hypothetical protein